MAEGPTATNWAYLAGFLDGEGSIVLTHRKNREGLMSNNSYEFSISLVNTNLEVIELMQSLFGGHTHQDTRGLKPGNRLGSKPIHSLVWNSREDTSYILSNILEYLVIKKMVAEAALNFVSIPLEEREMRIESFKYFEGVK